jgi:hypothetical protein
MSLEKLILDVISNSTDIDFVVYREKVKGLLENVMIKFDQDVEYQRDLEEQIDSLETENLSKDKCIKRLSRDAKEAIDECKCEADGMAEKMMSTVKLLQNDNAVYQVTINATNFIGLQNITLMKSLTKTVITGKAPLCTGSNRGLEVAKAS